MKREPSKQKAGLEVKINHKKERELTGQSEESAMNPLD